MRSAGRVWQLWAVLLVLPAATCGSDLAGAQRDLDSARAQWEELRPEGYSIDYERRCLCGNAGRFVADVEGETVMSVTPELGIGGDVELPSAYTVEMLFATIQAGIDRGADSVDVEYDAATGYPRSIAIDGDKRAEDDELVVTALVTPHQ